MQHAFWGPAVVLHPLPSSSWGIQALAAHQAGRVKFCKDSQPPAPRPVGNEYQGQGRGGGLPKDLNVTVLLGEGPLQRSSKEQLSEIILACLYFFILVVWYVSLYLG